MKKIITGIAVISLMVLAFTACQKEAENVLTNTKIEKTNISKSLAKKVALNFTKTYAFRKKLDSFGKGFKVSPIVVQNIKDIYSVYQENGQPAFYIVNFYPKGFVLIAATLKEEPILAFSNSTTFVLDSIPYGLKLWIDVRKQRIEKIIESDIMAPKGITDEWDKFISPPTSVDPETGNTDISGQDSYYHKKILPLNTKWGQEYGYNALLTPINGQLPPAGCVAVAMAQVMKYYQYPKYYKWDLMPDYKATNASAQLLKDVGVKVKMKYGLDGSGANSKKMLPIAFKEFGYSGSVRYSEYKSDLIKAEIDAGHPVIFSGGTKKYWVGLVPYYADGHAWVCYGYSDGYSEGYGYFSMYMNWGWYGSCDGWYSYNNFNTENGSFNYKVGTIIGIKP